MTGRYRAERSTHLPAGAINKAHVYDFVAGQIALRADGRLACFPTMAAAERWADLHNAEPDIPVPAPAGIFDETEEMRAKVAALEASLAAEGWRRLK